MSIQSNFPAIKPTLLLDFANVEQLDPRITFTRASTATYYGTQTAKAEENLVLQSQTFDQGSAWATSNSTISANTVAAPDNTTTADTFTASAGNTEHFLTSVTFNPTNGQRFVVSVFAKKNTHDFIQFAIGNQAGTFANYNLATGATGTSSGVVSTAITETPAGSGWYRISMVFDYSATVISSLVMAIVDSSSALRRAAFNAAGTEAIYLWGAQVEQRSAVTAYTPTTTQTITNYIPQLLTAASGAPRFDHNPTTFESLGLLIEEQRTNLVTYSEQFDNATWSKTFATITANTIVAPDGALTGDKLVSSSTTNFMGVNQLNVSVVSGNSYTMTAYVKAGEWQYAYLQVGGTSWTSQGQNSGIRFDLISGTVAGAYNGQSTANGSISNVGNGWFRISTVWTCNLTTTSGAVVLGMTNTNNTVASTGDGYSGIFIWGAQVEAGAFPTSYIPTVASQVTRAADLAAMTGTNFSSWYNQAEGTIYAEASIPAFSASSVQTHFTASLNDGTSSNRTLLRAYSNGIGGIVFDGQVVSGGVAVFDSNDTLGAANTPLKQALAYQVNNFAQCANGGTVSTDTSGVLPLACNTLSIGIGGPGGVTQSQNIRKIAYYPLRVTNAQLQGLTS